MLFVLFQLGSDRYAIDTACVVEVLPLIEITRVPHAPPEIAGICDRRGAPIPVVDLSQLLAGRPAEHRLSTRILIVRYTDGRGIPQLLGLIAEKATEVTRREPEAFVDSGITNRRTPYLGTVSGDAHGMVQRIDVATILPDAVRDVLFAQAGAP
jgi:chemotaxis-related protein WspB